MKQKFKVRNGPYL